MATTEALNDTLAAAKAEVERIEQEIAARNDLTEEQRFAIDLHDATCHQDHTERCGWFYDNGPYMWENGTHKRYLLKAREVLKVVDAETVMKVLKAVRGI